MRTSFCLCVPLLCVAGPLIADEPAKGPTRTILVYEIDPRGSADVPADLETLVKALARRINPERAYDIVIRPVGKDRIEINLPTGKRDKGLSAEQVRQIKTLATTPGKLEFRILANGHDDRKAIADAARLFDQEGVDKELADMQRRGLPPPAPRDQGKTPKKYSITLTKGARSDVTYRWVELSPRELRSLDLDHDAKDDPKRRTNWRKLARNRNKAATLIDMDHPLWQGALFFSRECQDRNLSDKKRKAKAVEYFVLARDQEFDPKTKKPIPPLTGAYFTRVKKEIIRVPGPGGAGEENFPVIDFKLSDEGLKLLRDFSARNAPMNEKGDVVEVGEPKDGILVVPAGTILRQLAFVLDGEVVSASTLYAEFAGGETQLSGNFTEKEIDALVTILRSGALPARLRPDPVSEVTVSSE